MKDLGLDPIGIALGYGDRGYHRFSTSSGVGGLAKWDGERIDILAIHSEVGGVGNVRGFFGEIKRRYRTICVWCIWNEHLRSELARYGFSDEVEVQGDGEILDGMRWDR